MATTLTHTTHSGDVYTRRTAHPYTAVAITRDRIGRDADGWPIYRHRVMSWHLTLRSANKRASSFNGGYAELINHRAGDVAPACEYCDRAPATGITASGDRTCDACAATDHRATDASSPADELISRYNARQTPSMTISERCNLMVNIARDIAREHTATAHTATPRTRGAMPRPHAGKAHALVAAGLADNLADARS